MDTKFLDEAIVELAKGGPRETWSLAAVDGPTWREPREAWATRIVDDALALAARRELKLLECEAVDLTAQRARVAEMAAPPSVKVDENGDCPHCETERAKADALDAHLALETAALLSMKRERDEAKRIASVAYSAKAHAVVMRQAIEHERDSLRSEVEKLTAERDSLRSDAARLTRERDAAHAQFVKDGATHWRVRGELNDLLRAARAERDEFKLELSRSLDREAALKSAPASVAVTDIGKAAEEMAEQFTDDFDSEPSAERDYLAILRKHTRTWTVEEIAEVVDHEIASARMSTGKPWAPRIARAVLSLLGGKPSAPKRPFVVDRERAVRVFNDNACAPDGNPIDAVIAEITAQRERWEREA